jgi:ssDNA-specific exonuclease RecJ
MFMDYKPIDKGDIEHNAESLIHLREWKKNANDFFVKVFYYYCSVGRF